MVESGFHDRLCRECRLGNLRFTQAKCAKYIDIWVSKIRGFVAYWTCWCCLVFFQKALFDLPFCRVRCSAQSLACQSNIGMHLFSCRALLKVEPSGTAMFFTESAQNSRSQLALAFSWLSDFCFRAVCIHLDTKMPKLAWLLISTVSSGHMTPEDSGQCGNEAESLLQTAKKNPFLSLAELNTQADQAGAIWGRCCRVLNYLKYAWKLKMIFVGCPVAISTCVKSQCFLLQLQVCVCRDSL